MIISASRRTDIPAFYGDWFVNRLREKAVYVRNPMNPNNVTKIDLSPQFVDCIVFWTKNPGRFIKHLDEIEQMGHRYYFQFTLTPYEGDIETGLPDKESIIKTFVELSERIGKGKVMWRYDPLFTNEKYTAEYHADKFEYFCNRLSKSTEKCVISFIDNYSFLNEKLKNHNINEMDTEEINEIMDKICPIAQNNSIQLATCCEKIDLSRYKIIHSKCIDDGLIKRLFGIEVTGKKDSGQRSECGCVVSRDIGAYDTCNHNCIYCYAKRKNSVLKEYDIKSPILCDNITVLEARGIEKKQGGLF
jgi:hypothetical protein